MAMRMVVRHVKVTCILATHTRPDQWQLQPATSRMGCLVLAACGMNKSKSAYLSKCTTNFTHMLLQPFHRHHCHLINIYIWLTIILTDEPPQADKIDYWTKLGEASGACFWLVG